MKRTILSESISSRNFLFSYDLYLLLHEGSLVPETRVPLRYQIVFLPMFSNVSKKSGGLDTLENIGKKTIGLISEGDPGLRNKRAFVQEQIEIITKEKVTNEEIDSDTPVLTTFHSEEQLQG